MDTFYLDRDRSDTWSFEKLTGGTVSSENERMNEKVVGTGGVRQTDKNREDKNVLELFSCLEA